MVLINLEKHRVLREVISWILEKEEVLVDKTKYLMLSGVEKFSFRQMRFVLSWGLRPKLNNRLEARPKNYQ